MQDMRLLGSVWAAIILAGCALFQPVEGRVYTQAPDAIFSVYTTQHATLHSDNVIALLSYTSSNVSKLNPSTWEDYRRLFDLQAEFIKTNNIIAPNYTVMPNAVEIALWRTYTSMWLADAKRSSVSPAVARRSYMETTAGLIFRIIDYEYKRE